MDIRWSTTARDAIWAAGVQAPYRESVDTLLTTPPSDPSRNECIVCGFVTQVAVKAVAG